MRILQVSSASYKVGGGVSEYIRNISERFARNHEVTVFAANPNNEFPKSELVNGVAIRRFNCFAPNHAFFLSSDLVRWLVKERFDVVHGHNYHAFPIHAAGWIKHSRFVVSPVYHGGGHTPTRDKIMKLLKPFGRITLKRADRVLAASEYEKQLLCRDFDFQADDVPVIPRGVNFDEFRCVKRRKHDFRSVLFVGRLLPYKGPQYLIEMLPKLRGDVILEIVGKGVLKDRMIDRAKKLRVYDRIRFYQDLERHELLQMYANADVFVLPSKYEAYSKVVAEAIVSGTPCVVAETSALQEWVDNKSCYGVKYPIDVDELSKTVSNVLESTVNSNSMKKWIGTKIIDWNDVVDRMRAIYEG